MVQISIFRVDQKSHSQGPLSRNEFVDGCWHLGGYKKLGQHDKDVTYPNDDEKYAVFFHFNSWAFDEQDDSVRDEGEKGCSILNLGNRHTDLPILYCIL